MQDLGRSAVHVAVLVPLLGQRKDGRHAADAAHAHGLDRQGGLRAGKDALEKGIGAVKAGYAAHGKKTGQKVAGIQAGVHADGQHGAGDGARGAVGVFMRHFQSLLG